MAKCSGIVAAGNTYNPCLLVLRQKGYLLSAEEGGELTLWEAKKDGLSFAGLSPPELLGIVALWERFGRSCDQLKNSPLPCSPWAAPHSSSPSTSSTSSGSSSSPSSSSSSASSS